MAVTGLVSLLLIILICGLLIWGAVWLLGLFGATNPLRNILLGIVVIVVVVWLLMNMGLIPKVSL